MDLRKQLLSRQELMVFSGRHIQESGAGRSLPNLARLLQRADAMIIKSDGERGHEIIVLVFMDKKITRLGLISLRTWDVPRQPQ